MGIETVLIVFGVIIAIAIGFGVMKSRRSGNSRVKPPTTTPRR